MASAGSEPKKSAGRNLTREDVISQAFAKLSTVSAKVTRDEVAEIVDGFGNTSGHFNEQAIQRAVAESLQLWSSRDQFGLLCTLRLNQEHLMDVQRDTIEKLESQNYNMKAQIDEKVAEKMAELRNEVMAMFKAQQASFPSSHGGGYSGQEKQREGQDPKEKDEKIEAVQRGTDSVQPSKVEGADESTAAAIEVQISQILQKLQELEGKVTKSAPEETQASKQKDAGHAGAEKILTEEEQKEKDAWGHLTSYDEALQELMEKDSLRNDLTKFSSLSEEIRGKHDLLTEVKAALPPLYFNPLERLGSSIKLNYQPFMKSLDELMEFHALKKPLFDAQVTFIANETQGKAVIPGMKGRPRCESKAAFKYTDSTGTSWHRCTDIVRATILYDDIASMYDGLQLVEKLHQDGKMEIVEFNDRYQSPMPGNYRDLQLSVKIADMVCELQMNTKVMAYVKENAGHRNFEVSRELIAAVKESNSERCSEILRWGTELLGEASVKEILNEKGKPVLHEAAKQGNANLVMIFLDHGADVNIVDGDGQTALHKAMAGGHERTVWALLCAGAAVVADKNGITPLIEGLLHVRVDPRNERRVRAVSTLAQKCDRGEFESLNEKLEAFAQKRLRQSSDLVTACKDGNLEKVERLLRDWADPDSHDVLGGGLHIVHLALHGGRMDFTAERAEVLQRLLDFRGKVDALAKTPEGKEQTALEVALTSSHLKAYLGMAVLIRHGATFMGKVVRANLSWESKQIQGAQPRELVQHFIGEWLPRCAHDHVSIDQSLMIKESALHVLLLRGYEVAKQAEADEEKRSQAAYAVAHLLGSHGHNWERLAFLVAECSPKDEDDAQRVYVVSGAGGVGSSCNGEYRQVREHNEKPLFKKADGAAIIYFDKRWKINNSDDVRAWKYMAPDVSAAAPPPGQWTTEGYRRGDADPAPVVSSYKDQGEISDHDQQMRHWLDLAAAASLGEKDVLLHAAVSCQVLKDSQGSPGVPEVQRASHLVATKLREKRRPEVAEGLLQQYSVEDFPRVTTLEDATKTVESISFKGDLLAAGSEDCKVRIYRAEQDFRLLKILDDAAGKINAVAWSSSTQLLAAGGDDKKIRVYDSQKDFQVIHTLDDASQSISCLAWSHELLATGSSDSKVRLYSLAQEFALVKTLEEARGTINCITWADGFLASGSNDQQVRIYSAKDFSLIKSLDQATNWIDCVAWSAQGLAAGGFDCQVRIYNPSEEFRLVATLSEASGWMYAVAWIQNLLGTGGRDQFVRIYDPAQEYAIVKIIKMPEIVTSITCFADQFAIASGQCIYLHDCAINYGSFDLEQLWDFAQPPEQQEERSPTSPSRRPAT